MLRYAKRAEARLTYAVAWSPGVLGGEPIARSGWTIAPDEPGGLRIDDAVTDEACVRAAFTGGRPGTAYRVRNFIVTAGGRRMARDLAIAVSA